MPVMLQRDKRRIDKPLIKAGKSPMKPCFSAMIIMAGLALGAQAAGDGPYPGFPLEGQWKHTTTDSAEYREPGFDDKAWTQAHVERLHGCPIGPTATDSRWYRTGFVMPASLKALAAKTGSLTVNFPDVMGQDVCYVNGKEVGKTEEDTGAARFYLIDEADLHFDRENCLAIRVHHNPWAGFKPVPVLTETLPANFLTLSVGTELSNRFLPKGKPVNYSLRVDNKLRKQQAATVIASFQDGAGRELYSAKKEAVLNTGENLLDFEYTAKVDLLKVVYTVKAAGFDADPPVLNAVYGYRGLEYHAADPVIAPVPTDQFQAAAFNEQRITGWLGSRLDINIDLRLKHVEEQRLLSGFVNRPGKQPYIGEHIGKFLEAACNSYQYTKDAQLKVLIDRMAQQLIACQLSDGYLGTYDPHKYWTRWDGWTHKYCLIGLVSYYRISGYQPALEAAEKIGDLMSSTFGTGPGQKDIIMESDGKEVGTMVGMATTSILEPMVDLYRFSGKAKYLDFCQYIVRSFDQANGPKIISTLNALGRVDKTANAKAYEMLSILVGLVKLHKVTGDQSYLKPALIAWRDVKENRLYITGSSSSHENFMGDHELPGGTQDNMAEGCVTTTWIQLNYQLFTLLGKIEFLDELERAVCNHLLGAENPRNGDVSYYTPLMGKKPYHDTICCCMSSVPRGIAMIPQFADGTLGNSPAILFYQPGVFRASVGKTAVAFQTETRFPEDGHVAITVDSASEVRFALQLRIPYWATDFTVAVNNVPQVVPATAMATLDRLWKAGDKIDVSFAMPTRILDGGKSYPGHVALKRGPQVLVFDQALNTVDAAKVSLPKAAVQLKDAGGTLPQGWIGSQSYQVDAVVDGAPTKIVLVPYCDAGQSGAAVTTWLKQQE